MPAAGPDGPVTVIFPSRKVACAVLRSLRWHIPHPGAARGSREYREHNELCQVAAEAINASLDAASP
jgi:hypothetical protein